MLVEIWKRPYFFIALNIFGLVLPQLALFGLLAQQISVFPALVCQLAVIFGCGIFQFFRLQQGLNACQAFISKHCDKIQDNTDSKKSKKILQICKRLAQKFKIQQPDIFITKEKSINASCYEQYWFKSNLCLSKGLIEAYEQSQFDDKAISAVIGHELSHLYHKDVLVSHTMQVVKKANYVVSAFAFFLLTMLGILSASSFFIPSIILMPQVTIPILSTLVLFSLSGPLSYLFYQSLMRAQEFRADRESALHNNSSNTILEYFKQTKQAYKQWGYNLFEDSYGNKSIYLDMGQNHLLGYNLEKLNELMTKKMQAKKTQCSKTPQNKDFVKGCVLFQALYKELEKDDGHEIFGNIRKKMDKAISLIFTKDEIKALKVLDEPKKQPKPVIPWYSAQSVKAYCKSYQRTHPSRVDRSRALGITTH